MKKCPYCAEEIQDQAIKCKHCGSDLTSPPTPPPPAPPPVTQNKKTMSKANGCLILLGLLFIAGIITNIVSTPSQDEKRPAASKHFPVKDDLETGSNLKKEAKPSKPREAYTVLKEEYTIIPLKAQVDLRILVDKSITANRLEALLIDLFNGYRQKEGYKYHDKLTNIYIYAYHNKETYEGEGSSWVGMLDWIETQPKANVSINNDRLAAIKEPEKSINGLSESVLVQREME